MNAILAADAGNSQEKAYHFLKSAILDCEYKSNQWLVAQDIAGKLQLSRTPVREALSRLEQEGLVVRDGGWGYIVKGITVKEAMDIYSVRGALEVEAVKELIPKIDNDLLKRLRSCLQKADEKFRQGRLKEYRDNTRAFYRLMWEACGNSCLNRMFSVIDDRIRWLGAMMTDKNLDRPRESLKGNKEILQALEARDAVAAEIAVRKHVSGAKESFVKYVTTGKGPVQI